MRPPTIHRLVVAFILTSVFAGPVAAQLIPIRTVPVASGDQFRLLPSERGAMGGVSLAVDDSLADAWSNPATGVRGRTTLFLSSPTLYAISQNGGGGRSFPVAAMLRGSAWFGGASLALQQIENSGPDQRWFLAEPAIDFCCTGQPPTLSDAFGRNLYTSAYVGRQVGDGPWSVGVALAGASLDAMDGVDLLYSGADRIEQSGSMADIRVGAVHDGPRDRLALLLVHDRVSMTHRVTYSDWSFDPMGGIPTFIRRLEVNKDATRTWGGNATWRRSLEAPGWKIGLSGTMNYKSHPQIPNYSLQNIPRDPGTTWAYEVGFGFSKADDATTFGLDVALQPIWSTTWQVADLTDVSNSSGRLRVGDRSIENDFFFTNVMLRTGLSHQIGSIGLQGGLEVRSYDYQLDQVNRVQSTFRDQRESWVEWTPTLGAVFGFESLDLRYALRVTNGTGRPGVGFEGAVLEDAGSPDVILAPEGPLTLVGARVVTQQISVAIPVR